jgi:hypothetical protein
VTNVGAIATAPTSLASRSALHRFTVLLWTILTLRLKTSRSSVRSMVSERQDDFDRANPAAYTGVPYQAAADDED